MGDFFRVRDSDNTEYNDYERGNERLHVRMKNRGGTYWEFKGDDAVRIYKILLPFLGVLVVAVLAMW